MIDLVWEISYLSSQIWLKWTNKTAAEPNQTGDLKYAWLARWFHTARIG